MHFYFNLSEIEVNSLGQRLRGLHRHRDGVRVVHRLCDYLRQVLSLISLEIQSTLLHATYRSILSDPEVSFVAIRHIRRFKVPSNVYDEAFRYLDRIAELVLNEPETLELRVVDGIFSQVVEWTSSMPLSADTRCEAQLARPNFSRIRTAILRLALFPINEELPFQCQTQSTEILGTSR